MDGHAGSSIGYRWPLLCAAGLVAGIGLGLLLAGPTESLLGVMLVLPVVGAVAGLTVGGAQVLADAADRLPAVAWAMASSAGLAVGLTVGTALVEAVGLREGVVLHDLAALAIIGGMTGAALGVAQWLAWPGRADGALRSWISASTAGLAAGTVAGGALAYLLVGTIRSVPAMAIIAAVAGATLGPVLARSLGRGRSAAAPGG